jgi:hypothetical protein
MTTTTSNDAREGRSFTPVSRRKLGRLELTLQMLDKHSEINRNQWQSEYPITGSLYNVSTSGVNRV